MTRQTCCKSKTPVLPPPPEPDNSAYTVIQDQVGGGRRQPSPPPIETPTRLQAHVKPMDCDTRLVQQVEYCRACLADSLVVESNLQPPSDPNTLVNDQHVPPFSDIDTIINPVLLAESPFMPAHPLPNDNSITPHLSTPPSIPVGNAVREHVPDVREPPPATQPNIPLMRIIPLTPIDASSSLVGGAKHANTGTSLPGQGEPSTPMAGRRTALINGILDEGYNDLENILTHLVNKTALFPQQIMDRWHKSKGQVINRVNHWNLYAKYLAKHEDQERQRLGLLSDVLSKSIPLVYNHCHNSSPKVTPMIRGQLYMKFKEENNEAWQEILELHDLLESSEALPQTIAHCMQSFGKIKRWLINLVSIQTLLRNNANFV